MQIASRLGLYARCADFRVSGMGWFASRSLRRNKLATIYASGQAPNTPEKRNVIFRLTFS
jgi:hypothetical protein